MAQVNSGEASVKPKVPVESNPRDSSGSSDFRGVRDVEGVAKVFQVGKRALCSPASVSPPTPTTLLSFFVAEFSISTFVTFLVFYLQLIKKTNVITMVCHYFAKKFSVCIITRADLISYISYCLSI